LISLIPALLGVSIIVFLFLRLIPGDPAVAMLGEHAAEENVERIREQFGLNRPFFFDPQALKEGDIGGFFDSQYIRYLGRLVRFDLGESIHRRIPITATLKERFPATVELATVAMLLAVIFGLPAGVISAARRNTALDYGTMIGALIGVSMPIYWLGLMLIMLFSVTLGWLPVGGRLDPAIHLETRTNFYIIDSILAGNSQALVDVLKHMVLPAVALATIPLAIIARMTRSSLLDVLGREYVRAAKAKGVPHRTVIAKHALRNALLPVVTIIGLSLGGLLGGAVLTETIFGLSGVGRAVYEAITARDYPIIQAFTVVIAVGYVLVNMIVDVSYTYLDPRVRLE